MRNVAQHMEVLCRGKNVNRHFRRNFDIFVTKITDLSSNTSICCKARVMFHVMKLGHYVIVDAGGNYVTFSKLNVWIKIKKIITPHNELEPPVFQCDRFIQICLLLAPPSL